MGDTTINRVLMRAYPALPTSHFLLGGSNKIIVVKLLQEKCANEKSTDFE